MLFNSQKCRLCGKKRNKTAEVRLKFSPFRVIKKIVSGQTSKLVVPVTNRIFSSTPVVLHLDVTFPQ